MILYDGTNTEKHILDMNRRSNINIADALFR